MRNELRGGRTQTCEVLFAEEKSIATTVFVLLTTNECFLCGV